MFIYLEESYLDYTKKKKLSDFDFINNQLN